MVGVDRYWLLTWTTYGQWLPGDMRGSVTRLKVAGEPHRIEEDQFGTPRADAIPNLQANAKGRLRGEPVRLSKRHAELLRDQFAETCRVRKWMLTAVAIMANHVHVLLGVPGDPNPDDLLRDLKAWGSRKLNQTGPRPASGTWWTQSGSKRRKSDEAAVLSSIEYLKEQEFPLLVWINPVTVKW